MRSNCTVHNTPQFQALSENQLEELHLATLEVLRRTGVDVLEGEARELLRRAGAKVDGTRVRIPPHLVEWAMRTAPPRIVLCDRTGNPAVYLEDGKGYYGTGSDTHYIIDPYTGRRRKPVKADIESVARVCDHLPNIDFVMCMGIASDVPESISDLHHFEAMVTNTAKPLVFTAWSLENLKDIVEMAEAVAGGEEALRLHPFITLYAQPISPLQMAPEGLEKLLYMAGKGLPTIWTPGMVAGATAPVTIAGAIVQGNAEGLAGLTVAQLRREGAPIVSGSGSMWLDMVSSISVYNAPESLISIAAWHQLTRSYRLPVWSYAGCSESKVFDEQAALEGAMVTLVAALSGGNLIHDVGYLESGLTTSFEMLVTSDEVIGIVKRFMQGIEVNEETLALDTINKVGPGGHFLGEDHTYRHFREHWYPGLLDRGNYQSWVANGKTTLAQRVNQRVREILETHSPEPLPEEARRELTKIIGRAEQRAR
jgi:trimethylamine--corrinoid protein Co-methyltransferase